MATGKNNPGEGAKLGYNIGVNLNYNMDDDYEEGKCGHGAKATAGVITDRNGFEMGRASGVLCKSRAVDKKYKVAVDAQGRPGGKAGSGSRRQYGCLRRR